MIVRDLVRGAREENPAVVAYRLGSHGRDAQRLGDPAEFRLREYVQTALLPLRQHEPLRQFVAVFRGEEDPALVIQPRRVRTEKHRHSPPLPPTTTVHCGPSRPTVHHCTPHSTTVNCRLSLVRAASGCCPTSMRWSGVGSLQAK